MEISTDEIPMIDLAKFCLDIKEEDVSEEDLEVLANQICEAFKSREIVYLKNHGIPQSKFVEIQRFTKAFFTLPPDVKQAYARSKCGLDSNHGWVCVGNERNNTERPPDLKETYDISPAIAKSWPDAQVPGFQDFMVELYQTFGSLANRIHKLLGIGLKLKDPELFRRNHNPMSVQSAAAGRLLYYPVVPEEDYEAEQIRCGEHTDYGTMTLLMQDESGGLESKNKRGEFIAVTPIPGTIVVNIGDLMQRWTSDQLVANTHRVVCPTSEIANKKPRIAFAYFVQPDRNCVVRCIDGSNKYDPITAGEFIDKRIQETKY